MKQVWFWQLIISPHMINLAESLSNLGVEVNYVVKEEMSGHRADLGWQVKYPNSIKIHLLTKHKDYKYYLNKSDESATHIFQGIRGNGYITELMNYSMINNKNFWVVMETVKLHGLKKYLKEFEYKRLFKKYEENLLGILAIGHTSVDWLKKIGVESSKIYSFAYFLESSIQNTSKLIEKFIFIYVGSLIDIKRPSLILEGVSKLHNKKNVEVWFLGDGALKNILLKRNKKLGLNIKFFGNISIEEVRQYLAQSDCLILPSLHDGWGAVTSEALIEGSRVICSDSCGSARTVELSNTGGVFSRDDINQLHELINEQLIKGKVYPDEREKNKKWATCLTSDSGAGYLYNILFPTHVNEVVAPWEYK